MRIWERCFFSTNSFGSHSEDEEQFPKKKEEEKKRRCVCVRACVCHTCVVCDSDVACVCGALHCADARKPRSLCGSNSFLPSCTFCCPCSREYISLHLISILSLVPLFVPPGNTATRAKPRRSGRDTSNATTLRGRRSISACCCTSKMASARCARRSAT